MMIRSPTLIFAILVFASLAQWLIAETSSKALSPIVAATLLSIVWVKCHLLIADFLHLRGLKQIWRTAVYIWLNTTLGFISVLYLLAR